MSELVSHGNRRCHERENEENSGGGRRSPAAEQLHHDADETPEHEGHKHRRDDPVDEVAAHIIRHHLHRRVVVPVRTHEWCRTIGGDATGTAVAQ